MNTQMNLRRISVEKLKPAKYNPRKDLRPGDPAYEKIKRSLHDFGYVDPVIWNEVTGNIVGGHQRYKVLLARGRDGDRLRGSCIQRMRRRKRRSTLPSTRPWENGSRKRSPICLLTFSFPGMTWARRALTRRRLMTCFPRCMTRTSRTTTANWTWRR